MASGQKEKTTICEAGIVGLCFNADGTQAAFSPNSHVIHVADTAAAGQQRHASCLKWKVTQTLEAHDQAITSIDWAQKSNRIVSCAQDRTAFVWTYSAEQKQWVAVLVMIDSGIKRGLTCCTWSSSEKKVLIGSATCNIAVCWFVEKNNWWWSNIIEGPKSTVTTVAAHPFRDMLFAHGSTDNHVRIGSCFLKALDGAGKGEKIGTSYHEYRLNAWVNGLSWSPDGFVLAAASHGSSIYFGTVSADVRQFVASSSPSELTGAHYSELVWRCMSLNSLPMRSLRFLSANCLVAAGHDFYPVCFSLTGDDGGEWRLCGKWSEEKKEKKEMSAAAAARLKFQNEASLGQSTAIEVSSSKHKNTITAVRSVLAAADVDKLINDSPTSDEPIFATSSMDGRVEYWSLKEMTTV